MCVTLHIDAHCVYTHFSTGVGVPHDLSLNAAMLYVVITLRTIPASDSLDPAITCITTDWLGTMGSPLNSFSRLAVCHALLAKLPPPSLLVEAGGKPCLLQLFPIISALFDRYVTCTELFNILFGCVAASLRLVIGTLQLGHWHSGLP